MKMYDYLVSYHFQQEGYLSFSIGTSQISTKKKITTFEDINKMQETLLKSIEKAKNLGIINICYLGRNKH